MEFLGDHSPIESCRKISEAYYKQDLALLEKWAMVGVGHLTGKQEVVNI